MCRPYLPSSVPFQAPAWTEMVFVLANPGQPTTGQTWTSNDNFFNVKPQTSASNLKLQVQVLTLNLHIKLQLQNTKSNLNIKPQLQSPSQAELGPAQPQLVCILFHLYFVAFVFVTFVFWCIWILFHLYFFVFVFWNFCILSYCQAQSKL